MTWLLAHFREIDLVAHLVVLVGVPAGLIQFWLKVRRERRDREYGTYNALDEKYLEFQRLCLEHPHLDVFDIADKESRDLSPEEKKQELVAFTLLMSVFERAFLMYRGQSKRITEKQWAGWEEYLASYCRRPNFLEAWEKSGHTFDDDFERHVNRCIRSQNTHNEAPEERDSEARR